MSANRWSVCPKCGKPPETPEDRQARLRELYGKVSAEEFQALTLEAENYTSEEPEETLREDWELYWESPGVLKLSYGCSCDSCGFRASWSQRRILFKKS